MIPIQRTILLFAIMCKTLAEQRFVETPLTYQEVSSGDDVQLRCRVQDKRGQCIWQKDRKPVATHPDKYEWASGRGNDCTLLIRRASLDFDDGYWECQVTSGDFTRQDALTSLPARLLVRVKPRKPRLEYGGTILSSSLTLREGQEVTISCVSRYGNPAALIKWYIGGDEVEPLREQTNATEVDNPKTWAAHSLLRVRGQRENHGLPIRCITMHSSSLIPGSAETLLDTHYSPEVKLETKPRILLSALEDSTSFISLTCYADANPMGTIKWFKDSIPITTTNNIVPIVLNKTQQNSTIIGSELKFQPVKRTDAGLFSCKASNIIGESVPANYRLDVQYAPTLRTQDIYNETIDKIEETTLLGSTIEPFECSEFQGNPSVQYKWIHIRGTDRRILDNHSNHKESGKRLRLENVIWSDDGDYRCVAYNIINGVLREMPSEVRYILHVTGPPEIQLKASSGENGLYESYGWAGQSEKILKLRFCSRPPPRLVAWQWGSSHIRAGEIIHPKYEALQLERIKENETLTNCYFAKLRINDLQKEDSRIYTLLIESEKGRDSTNIKLIIRDPTEIRVIIAGISIGLLFLLLLITIAVYSLLRLKNTRYVDDDDDNGSIPADALYSSRDRDKNVNLPTKSFTAKRNDDDGLTVMYDYDHVNKYRISPEAMKVRRAPAVLQPPTIV